LCKMTLELNFRTSYIWFNNLPKYTEHKWGWMQDIPFIFQQLKPNNWGLTSILVQSVLCLGGRPVLRLEVSFEYEPVYKALPITVAELSSRAQTVRSWVQIPLEPYVFMCVYSVFVYCVQIQALHRADPHRRSPTDCRENQETGKATKA
jgi:hypothetical protein